MDDRGRRRSYSRHSSIDRYFPGHGRRIEPSSSSSYSRDRSRSPREVALDPRLKGTKDVKDRGRKPLLKLKVPIYEWDENSIGGEPKCQVLVTGLPLGVAVRTIATALSEFGPVDHVEIVKDDDAAPLNIASVVFKHQKRDFAIAKKASRAGKVFIETKQVDVCLDIDGQKCKRKRRELIDRQIILAKPAPKGPRSQEQPPSTPVPPTVVPHSTPTATTTTAKSKIPPLTRRLREEIGRDPFVFVSERSVPISGRDAVSRREMFDFVQPFRPRTILMDELGWYIVFRHVYDCRDCVYELDGVRLFGFKVWMEDGSRPPPPPVGPPPSAPQSQPQAPPQSQPQPSNSLQSSSVPSHDLRNGNHHSSLSSTSTTPRPNGTTHKISQPSKDPVASATDIIKRQLGTALMKEIKQRVITHEIHAAVKSHFTKIQEKEALQAEKTKEREAARLKELEARKKKKLSLQKPLKPMFDEESDAMSTRMTTPVESTPVDNDRSPDAQQLKQQQKPPSKQPEDDNEALTLSPRKRKSIRDFSSSDESESEDSGLTNKRFKRDAGAEDVITSESTPEVKVEVDEPVKPIEPPKPIEPKIETESGRIWCGVDWQPKPGKGPVSIVEGDHPGPYDVVGVLDMIKDVEDLEIIQEIAKGKKYSPAIGLNENNLEAYVYRQRQLPRVQDKSPFTSFRSRGYRKISEAEKDQYLVHRRENKARPVQAKDDDKEQVKSSSRSNRVMARREEKQVSEMEILSINKLKKRKKPVEFRRSAIHDWGLYAMEAIPAGEMIIEYVGEVIRSSLQDTRERKYQLSGIGSSYLFHVDNTQVIDATKRGGIARFINHSCQPSCIAKIIRMQGTSRIVIYAARDIGPGEELTYDYKFEREEGEDRVPCLCGAEKCKGWLN